MQTTWPVEAVCEVQQGKRPLYKWLLKQMWGQKLPSAALVPCTPSNQPDLELDPWLVPCCSNTRAKGWDVIRLLDIVQKGHLMKAWRDHQEQFCPISSLCNWCQCCDMKESIHHLLQVKLQPGLHPLSNLRIRASRIRPCLLHLRKLLSLSSKYFHFVILAWFICYSDRGQPFSFANFRLYLLVQRRLPDSLCRSRITATLAVRKTEIHICLSRQCLLLRILQEKAGSLHIVF